MIQKILIVNGHLASKIKQELFEIAQEAQIYIELQKTEQKQLVQAQLKLQLLANSRQGYQYTRGGLQNSKVFVLKYYLTADDLPSLINEQHYVAIIVYTPQSDHMLRHAFCLNGFQGLTTAKIRITEIKSLQQIPKLMSLTQVQLEKRIRLETILYLSDVKLDKRQAINKMCQLACSVSKRQSERALREMVRWAHFYAVKRCNLLRRVFLCWSISCHQKNLQTTEQQIIKYQYFQRSYHRRLKQNAFEAFKFWTSNGNQEYSLRG